MSESENHRSTYMCTQYDACSNLPIVTAGDDTGVLKMMGSECMSESETSCIDIIYIYVHNMAHVSNLPTVTAGDFKGVLTTRGLECVSENENHRLTYT